MLPAGLVVAAVGGVLVLVGWASFSSPGSSGLSRRADATMAMFDVGPTPWLYGMVLAAVIGAVSSAVPCVHAAEQ